ncbi:hypothetical protein [Lentibacillus salinarum]|uniref:Alcohol dehydrogenase n=1 Tax=Lentibacillus salinarum TaxID=446820 RepID=A0ABW3ZYU6_9BACI
MADKKSALKGLFSKSNKDCCSVEIEEVKPTEDNSCCGSSKENTDKQQKEA